MSDRPEPARCAHCGEYGSLSRPLAAVDAKRLAHAGHGIDCWDRLRRRRLSDAAVERAVGAATAHTGKEQT